MDQKPLHDCVMASRCDVWYFKILTVFTQNEWFRVLNIFNFLINHAQNNACPKTIEGPFQCDVWLCSSRTRYATKILN